MVKITNLVVATATLLLGAHALDQGASDKIVNEELARENVIQKDMDIPTELELERKIVEEGVVNSLIGDVGNLVDYLIGEDTEADAPKPTGLVDAHNVTNEASDSVKGAISEVSSVPSSSAAVTSSENEAFAPTPAPSKDPKKTGSLLSNVLSLVGVILDDLVAIKEIQDGEDAEKKEKDDTDQEDKSKETKDKEGKGKEDKGDVHEEKDAADKPESPKHVQFRHAGLLSGLLADVEDLVDIDLNIGGHHGHHGHRKHHGGSLINIETYRRYPVDFRQFSADAESSERLMEPEEASIASISQ